jgi:hypothetical protein
VQTKDRRRGRDAAELRRASPTNDTMKVYFPISRENATLSMPFESNDFVLCTVLRNSFLTGLYML